MRAKNLLFLILSMATVVSSGNPLCAEAARELVALYQKGAVRLTKDPVADWIAKSGDKKLARAFINQLEDEIIKVLEITPETRQLQLKTFAATFGFSEPQAKDVVLYYATNIYEEPRLVNPVRRRVSAQLTELLRAHRLSEPSTVAEHLYLYYLLNISKLSVPEMAKQLGVTENQVYEHLSSLKLSIEAEFRDYDTAQEFLEAGFSMREVADSLGIGEQALAFLMHYKHQRSRARPWARSDESLIVSLRAQGHTVQEIADRLNQTHGTRPGHDRYRTAGAVQAKLEQLAEAGFASIQIPRREIEPYGLVKDKGKLQPVAKQYLEDHYFLPLDVLARELRVTTNGLKRFIRRESVVLLANANYRRTQETRKMIRGYEAQRDERARLLERFIIEAGYRLPRKSVKEEAPFYGRLKKTNSERIRKTFKDQKAMEIALLWRIERRETRRNPLLGLEEWIVRNGLRLPKGSKNGDREEIKNYQRLKAANPEAVSKSFTNGTAKQLVTEWLSHTREKRVKISWPDFEAWILKNECVMPKCVRSLEPISDLSEAEQVERQMYGKLASIRHLKKTVLKDEKVIAAVSDYMKNKLKRATPVRARVPLPKALEQWIIDNEYRLPRFGKKETAAAERQAYKRLVRISKDAILEISDEKARALVFAFRNTTAAQKGKRVSRAKLEPWIIDHGYTLPRAGRRGVSVGDMSEEERLERLAYAQLVQVEDRIGAIQDPRVKQLLQDYVANKQPNTRGKLIQRAKQWIIENGYRLPSIRSENEAEVDLADRIYDSKVMKTLLKNIDDARVLEVLKGWKPDPQKSRLKKKKQG